MSRFFDRRLLSAAAPQRVFLGLAVLGGAVAGIFTVFQAGALSRAVSRVFLAAADLAAIRPLIVALVAFSLARGLANWLGELAAVRVAQHVKADLRGRLTRHIVSLGPTYLQGPAGERTGELVNTALDGVEALDAYFSQYLPQVALAAVVPLTFLLFVFPIDALSALVLLLTAPLIPLFMALIGSLTDSLTRRQWSTLSRLAAHFLDVLQGLTTLKLFNRSREQIILIRRISEQHRDATLQVLRVAFLSAFVLEMIGTLSTAIVAVEVGLRLLAGRLTFEPAFFVLILAPEFYLPLRQLGLRFHAGVSGVAAAQRIFDLLDTPPALAPRASLLPPPAQLKIDLRNLTVAYPDRALPALAEVSFTIEPGEHVALVGPTGAGKSTVAALLLRFVEPQAGEITVDGVDLARLSPDEWRARVAYVPQAPYLFNASVADNIRLGRPSAPMDEVLSAATAARADHFIAGLADGYDTVIGERGTRLSGGQAQRIALARAFLAGAPFVILDEATANLDPETDADVQASLRELLAGRTALIIAHRLSTVHDADKIVVLERGRVVEQGRHEALIAAGGMYAGMVAIQGSQDSPIPLTSETGPEAPDILEAERDEGPAAPPPPLVERRSWEALGGLLPFLTPHAGWIALSVLLGFLTVGSSIGLLASSAWIIATAALQPSIAVLQVAIVGVRFFGIARGVFRYLERLASHQVTFRVLAAVRVWFYAAIEPIAPARLAQYESGDLLARVLSDVGLLENFYVRAVSPPLVALLVALLTAVLLTGFNPALVMPVLALQAVAGIGLPLLALRLGREPGRGLTAGRGALNQSLVDLVQGLPDLLAFGAGARQLRGVDKQGASLGRSARRMAGVSAGASASGSVLSWLAVAAVLAVATPLVRAGQLSGVSLAVLALLTAASFEAVLPLPIAGQYLTASAGAARRLFEVAGKRPRMADVVRVMHSEAASLPPTEPAARTAPAIEFSRVSLRYMDGEPLALDHVTLTIPPGERLTVVGPSGAGKSSLANVLLRFWDYQGGTIQLDGRDLATIDGEEVRASVAVVAQSTHLFNASIRTNLLLARPDATPSELEAAARAAQLHDFIASLPQGYDTQVGEGGRKLSGGERQRLAIARALLKNAPILVLDEPAAALDAATESALWTALEPLFPGRTSLVITHRLDGPACAGRIVVMDAGRVVEMGDHESLLAAGGLYRRLWEQQRTRVSCPPGLPMI